MDGVKEVGGPRVLRIVGMVFGAIAMVAFFVAILLATLRWNEVSAATATTQGTVVAFAHGRKGSAPVVELTPPGGDPVRITGRISSKPARYHVGEQVAVRYDPKVPAHAMIDTFFEIWLLPFIFGCMGGGYMATAALLFFLSVLGRAREQRLRQVGDRVSGTIVAYIGNAKNRKYIRLAVELREEPPRKILSQTVSLTNPQGLVGKAVTVLVDPQNRRRHLVDFSSL
jgi:uncharacterized protein (DUF58 family)